MRGRLHRIALVLATALAAAGGAAHAAAAAGGPWMDASLSPDQRAHLLVRAMTAAEKDAYLGGQCDPRGHTGLLLGVPRLGIPDLYFNDGPVGVHEEPTGGFTASPGGVCATFNPGEVGEGRATQMPSPMSLAASFDERLARTYGEVVGDEAARTHNHVIFGPDVNIMRDPRGGRTFEAYGEDPYLAARMAVGWIEGLQSRDVIADVKHFMANNEEDGRQASDSRVDERTEREIYMPAFEAAVTEADVGSVMAAYNKVNGRYMTANRPLLSGALEHDWGFRGFVLTDYGALHSTVRALNAGTDLELPYQQFYDPRLVAAARTSGLVRQATIDAHVTRILRTMFRFGLFDHPERWQPRPIDFAAGGASARRVEAGGIVLLRNEHGALPLPASAHSIAVIGRVAAELHSGGGSSKIAADHMITPLDGIRARAGKGVDVRFDDGSDPARAAALAARSDVAIVFGYDVEGEGSDRACLALECSSQDPDQDGLIAAVAAANPRTVAVLETGGPVLTPWIDRVAGALEAWYPGEEGGLALAAVLFGDTDPGGRLPATFPAAAGDVPASTPAQWPGIGLGDLGPLNLLVDGMPPPANVVPPKIIRYSEGVLVGYRHYDANAIVPRFPFGFGLSYTTWRYGALRIAARRGLPAAATVTAQVTNTGRRTGSDVAQLYVGIPSPNPDVVEPPRQLKGFRKVLLRPGRTGHVRFALDARSFSWWDAQDHRWRVTPGCYPITIGRSSRDPQLEATVAIGAARCPGAAARLATA